MAAAKLEEAQGNKEIVDKIISRAIKKLIKLNIKIKRDQWLMEAIYAEQSESVLTCKAIIKMTMHHGLDDLVEPTAEEDEKLKQVRRIWIENADACISKGSIETARALISNALLEFPNKKKLYLKAIKIE